MQWLTFESSAHGLVDCLWHTQDQFLGGPFMITQVVMGTISCVSVPQEALDDSSEFIETVSLLL